MRALLFISLIILLGCEEVVIVDLPQSQNLIVIEGWVTDTLGNHPIRITRSRPFSDQEQIAPIDDAQVIVQSRSGQVFAYSYTPNGVYVSDFEYQGIANSEYRIIALIDSLEIRSEWDELPEKVEVGNIRVESFEENDPDNPNQQITIYYPKLNAIDPEGIANYYRWLFFKNDEVFNEPEPITIQNDRLFDGNVIPNNFQSFGYDVGDEMTVQLMTISRDAHNYLSLLKSQITTLGTSGGTTPAIVNGNLFYVNDNSTLVLGYFGTAAISKNSLIVE
ncbi:DUF4249 domain-containing protein [Ekhidna sp.]|uniref:DUF4249 domain-containing protein n=1 Tax=Ekhidna sp. TaxID=2608089 RepID=UPI003BA8A6C6